jgi:glycosyltransferase involved in cell wall biosynthesis
MDELDFIYNRVLTDEHPVFGYCGRLSLKEKGLDLLIEGMSLYKSAGGKGELWLIGDGPDYDKILNLIERANLTPFVKILGVQFGSAKLNLIANMDWFVLTSRNEGMPTSVLEAAALRIPCIVSKETNLGKHVQEFNAGIVLEVNDSFNICKALIQTSLIKKEQPQIGLNAHFMITKEFNWQIIAKQFITYYHEYQH